MSVQFSARVSSDPLPQLRRKMDCRPLGRPSHLGIRPVALWEQLRYFPRTGPEISYSGQIISEVVVDGSGATDVGVA